MDIKKLAEEIARTSNETAKSVETIAEQLEYRKPKSIMVDFAGVERCPTCESPYISDEHDIQYDYCPDCGQMLKHNKR